MVPHYPPILYACKVCGGDDLLLSKPHGPPQKRGGVEARNRK